MPTNSPQSKRAWAHNGLFGSAAMARTFLNSVIQRESTTDAAQRQAVVVLKELGTLTRMLEERTDPCVERGAMYCSHKVTPQCHTDKTMHGEQK